MRPYLIVNISASVKEAQSTTIKLDTDGNMAIMVSATNEYSSRICPVFPTSEGTEYLSQSTKLTVWL